MGESVQVEYPPQPDIEIANRMGIEDQMDKIKCFAADHITRFTMNSLNFETFEEHWVADSTLSKKKLILWAFPAFCHFRLTVAVRSCWKNLGRNVVRENLNANKMRPTCYIYDYYILTCYIYAIYDETLPSWQF